MKTDDGSKYTELVKLQALQNAREQAKDLVDYYEGENWKLPRFKSINRDKVLAERAALIATLHANIADNERERLAKQ